MGVVRRTWGGLAQRMRRRWRRGRQRRRHGGEALRAMHACRWSGTRGRSRRRRLRAVQSTRRRRAICRSVASHGMRSRANRQGVEEGSTRPATMRAELLSGTATTVGGSSGDGLSGGRAEWADAVCGSGPTAAAARQAIAPASRAAPATLDTPRGVALHRQTAPARCARKALSAKGCSRGPRQWTRGPGARAHAPS